MFDQFARTRLLIGEAGLKKLNMSKVTVFGVGGVGSFAAEALARAGVGALTLVDYDVVCLTNVNRQLCATHKTVGRAKVAVMKERILDINPAAKVTAVQEMCREDNCVSMIDSDCDYIIDAIDMLAAKIALIVSAKEKGVPIVSSMGAGNKLDPAKFEVADIYRTSVCPLAKAVRKELKKRGVTSLKVVYSQETPLRLFGADGESENQPAPMPRRLPGSISFVPPVAGLILAGEAVKDILAFPPMHTGSQNGD